MELVKVFEKRRWEIVYGAYEGLEQRAIDLLQKAIKRYVPYILTLRKAPSGEANVLYVGTKESNPYIASLLKDKELPEHGCYGTVFGEGEEQTAIVCGADAVSCFYAAVEFADDYLPLARRKPVGHPFFRTPFVDELPPYEKLSVPSVQERGLWTWGHVIYDYRSYLENMARLKMNKITIWNDFAPINGKDVVNCAHSWGIKVIWGYSWIWDEKPDDVLSDASARNAWKNKIVDLYETQYAPLGGDGIYFQTFTETDKEEINGRNRAAAAVDWVNEVASALLEKFPDLKIEFGLHATSVKNHLDEIAKTDKRVSIVWEDCGAFPFAYGAQNLGRLEETEEFSHRIATLRSEGGFGAVLKGQSWLDWSAFAHQIGPFLLGESSAEEIEEKTQLRRDILRYQQSFWLQNGEVACRVLRALAEDTDGNAALSGLLEDGMFEKHIWLPSALFAELLWDRKTPYPELLSKVSRREIVSCIS